MGPSQSYLFLCLSFSLFTIYITLSGALLTFPKDSNWGIIAAVATPLDIPNRNIYMAFNFEVNYGLPPNDSHQEWIDRWDLDESFLGIGSNVTPINGRRVKRSPLTFTRYDFYRSIVHYLGQFGFNGSACLHRTICEVSAAPLDVHNGVLGTIFKILFMPGTSVPESTLLPIDSIYEASAWGTRKSDCSVYQRSCPNDVLDMISVTL